MNEIFKGSMLQRGFGHRGHGLGGVMSKFMNWVGPAAKETILPQIPKLIESGAKIIGDEINNKYISKIDELKQKNDDTIKKDENQLSEKKQLFRGAGMKKSINRKRKSKQYIILKSKRPKDIFDNAF